jgi:uncharacterized Zn ribbon protein
MDIKVRDSNGAQLAEGDTVTLKLKGSSTVLKRGTVIRNIPYGQKIKSVRKSGNYPIPA